MTASDDCASQRISLFATARSCGRAINNNDCQDVICARDGGCHQHGGDDEGCRTQADDARADIPIDSPSRRRGRIETLRTEGDMKRFTSTFCCPICGGHDGLARGKGRRCYGFVSGDGRFARCSREELAGMLQQETRTGLFVHYLAGPCRCGLPHNDRPAQPLPPFESAADHDAAKRRQNIALEIWHHLQAIRGTACEIYLNRIRRIEEVPDEDELRFHPALLHTLTKQLLPAMVAPFRA
jgi:hypothetical protein